MLKKLTENIFYTEPDEATDRPAMGYIRGERLSLMAECGNSPKTVKAFLSGVSELGLKKPVIACATHCHWDHCFGMGELKRQGVLTVCSDKTNEILKDMSGWKWSAELLERYVEEDKIPLFCREHIINEYQNIGDIEVCPADIAYHGEMRVDLGGISCVLMAIPNPHTEDGTVIYVPEECVVFFGDCVCEELVRDQWVDNPKKAAEMYAFLDGLDFSTAVEGHFPPRPKSELMKELKERMEK